MQSFIAHFFLVVLGAFCSQNAFAQARLGAQGTEAEPARMQQWLVPSPSNDVAARALLFRPPGDGPFRLAVIYAALGDNDRAFEALDQATVRVPQRVGLLLRDPEMAALRGDPRFAAVRRKLGLP